MTSPVLVAHRGWISRHPENTLPALAAALERGARWIEVDVQLSADGVPHLFHDRTLKRTTNAEGALRDLDAAAIRRLDAGDAARLGPAFSGTRVPTLDEAVALLSRHPEANLFVEIKRTSIEHFGLEPVLDAILPALTPLGARALPICFSPDCVRALSGRGWKDRGWIMEHCDEESLTLAAELAPPLLFGDREILPADGPLPAGPWRWAVYSVDDVEEAKGWAARGVAFVETDAIGELLDDPELAAWGLP